MEVEKRDLGNLFIFLFIFFQDQEWIRLCQQGDVLSLDGTPIDVDFKEEKTEVKKLNEPPCMYCGAPNGMHYEYCMNYG